MVFTKARKERTSSAALGVLLIILGFSGLTSFSMADIRFNGWWLYALTWNVVVAFVLGVAAGHWWDKRAAKALQPTATAPPVSEMR